MAHPRDGFTLVEIVVVLVIVLALAAVIAPGVIGQIEHERLERSARSIRAIADAIDDPARGAGSFRQHVGVYPGALSHLTRPVSTTDSNICGMSYTPEDSAGWSGPYLNRVVPPEGIRLPLGTALDTLVRELVGSRPDPVVRITVAGVQLEEARALDAILDGVESGATGGFRWGGADPEGFTSAGYLLPVKDC